MTLGVTFRSSAALCEGRVAADRAISTVDPQPRTGTRLPPATSMATRVTSRSIRTRRLLRHRGHAGDAEVADGLLAGLVPGEQDKGGVEAEPN
jgi:hypothetical protein